MVLYSHTSQHHWRAIDRFKVLDLTGSVLERLLWRRWHFLALVAVTCKSNRRRTCSDTLASSSKSNVLDVVK